LTSVPITSSLKAHWSKRP